MKTYIKTYDPLTDFEAVASLILKPKDLEEVEASSGKPSSHMMLDLAEAKYDGEKFVIVHKGKIEGVLGVHSYPEHPEVGVVYFLTTAMIAEFGYSVAKYAPTTIQMFLEKYEILTNYTLSDYTVAIDWLTYSGATWDDSEYILEDPDVPFKQFYFQREN